MVRVFSLSLAVSALPTTALPATALPTDIHFQVAQELSYAFVIIYGWSTHLQGM